MQIQRYLLVVVASVAAPAWAQSAPQSLNLKLPPGTVSAQSATPEPAKEPASASAAAPALPAPMLPIVYDDDDGDLQASGAKACDDKTYGQPQVHGSIGMGIVAGSHVSGNYQTGTVQVTKALGSCDDPTGYLGLSISVGQGNFNHRHRGARWGDQGR
jgi:hypothetical protein